MLIQSIIRYFPLRIVVLAVLLLAPSSRLRDVSSEHLEYLWYEAENMRGISQTARHEPVLNPSYLELPAAKAPGWGKIGRAHV